MEVTIEDAEIIGNFIAFSNRGEATKISGMTVIVLLKIHKQCAW
jgi:hypothetical protein